MEPGSATLSPVDKAGAWIDWIVAIALTCATVGLHLARTIHAGGLWRDEVAALAVARSSTSAEMWAGMAHEVIPVVPLLILRAWTHMSWAATDLGLRVLGCGVGLLVVGALWSNARSTGRSQPLISVMLLGLGADVIIWGDSVRHYGISMAVTLLMFGAIWRLVESASPVRVAVAVSLMVLSVQCAYPNAYLVLGGCLGGAAVLARRQLWHRVWIVLGGGLIAAASLLFYVSRWQKMGEWAVVVQSPVTFSTIVGSAAHALGSPNASMLVIWVLLVAIGVVGAIRVNANRESRAEAGRRADLALFALIAFAISTTSYLFWLVRARYVTYDWNYLPLMAPMAWCTECMVEASFPRGAARVARSAILVAFAVVILPGTWREIQTRQTNMDLVAAHLNETVAQNDLIVVSPWLGLISLRRYYSGTAPCMTIPPMEAVTYHRFDLLEDRMSSENVMAPLLRVMDETLRAGNKVWLVGGLRFLAPGQEALVVPPTPRSGIWEGYIYEEAWSSQAAQHILSHIVKREAVEIRSGDPISPFENFPLFVVEGWIEHPE